MDEQLVMNCARKIATTIAACILLAGSAKAWAAPDAISTQDGTTAQNTTDRSATGVKQPEKKNEKIYRLGPQITPPTLVSSGDIDTVKRDQKLNFEGVAVVELEVNTQGIPKHVRVVRSAAMDAKKADKEKAQELDEKTLEAVRQYRFSPAKLNGQPISVRINIEVKFHIHR